MPKTVQARDGANLKELALRLGAIQREAKRLNIPAIVILEGIDGSGKGRLLNRMILQLDARAYDIYSTHAGDKPARQYPLLWRMWNHVPSRGRLQFFDRSAYYLVLDTWAEGDLDEKELSRYWQDIRHFERQLADDGTLIVKSFLIVSQKEQERRFKELEGNSSTSWRVTSKDWKRHKQYDDYVAMIRKMTGETDQPFAPWYILESDDLKEATARLYEIVIAAFEKAVADAKPRPARKPVKSDLVFRGKDHLAQLDLQKALDSKTYKKLLKKRQAEIHDLAHELHDKRIPVVMAYCGWDAAGKGGCIRRLLQGVDPRSFTVIPVGAPTTEELQHHYLWRFWDQMPPRGRIAIFDRSWYGRVLVERVEGFCSVEEWQRAYQEINEMEAHLAAFGTVLIKFWLHIDKETQLERFEARRNDAHKQWKITEEDWRNHMKFDDYYHAVNEMVERTNTPHAPWHLVSSVCKRYARIQTLDVAIARMKDAVKKGYVAPL